MFPLLSHHSPIGIPPKITILPHIYISSHVLPSWKPPYFTPQKISEKVKCDRIYPYFTRKNICAICDHRESISSKSPPLRRAPHSSRSAAALRRADRSVASADPSWRPRGRRLCRRPPAGRWPGPLRRFRSSWLFLGIFLGGTRWNHLVAIYLHTYK